MIRVTLTATPRRLAMLAAKAAVVTGWAAAAGALAVLGSVLAGRLIHQRRLVWSAGALGMEWTLALTLTRRDGA
jgi:hypothetical protein